MAFTKTLIAIETNINVIIDSFLGIVDIIILTYKIIICFRPIIH